MQYLGETNDNPQVARPFPLTIGEAASMSSQRPRSHAQLGLLI